MIPEEGYQEALRRIEEAHQPSIVGLSLAQLQLTSIPKELITCQNLQTLELSKNQIRQIENLPKGLQTLYLNENQINQIENLPEKLRVLHLNSNQISHIKNIPNGLQSLHLNENQISYIENLPSGLKTLDLNNNQISVLEKLPVGLKTLDLSHNRISRIENLPIGLQTLNLTKNQIYNLENLPSELQTLTIDYNHIQELMNLPDDLKVLQLKANRISHIINIPLGLHTLNLGDNKINQIKNLPPRLHTLELDRNQIRQIENLPDTLQNLVLWMNKIRQIENLPVSLQMLDLVYNQVEQVNNLPQSLVSLKIHGNPTRNIPSELLGDSMNINSLHNVKIWFANLEKDPIPNRTIKFMVSGNSNVGKSSLIEALRMGKAQSGHDSTHAVRIEPLLLPDGDQPVDGIVFDFGGQEIYHGTHQLFLRSRSVQVVVFDAETEATGVTVDRRGKQGETTRNKTLPNWLDDIQRLYTNSAFVLVQNKLELPATLPATTQNQINRLDNEQAAWIARVSALTGRYIPALRGTLVEAAKSLPEYGMLMPASWVAVRNYFLENSQKSITDLQRIVSRLFFNQLCAEQSVLPNSEAALLHYLHNTGVVYYNEKYFSDTIIADQQWVIEAIYEVLDRQGQLYNELKIGYGKKQLKYLFRYFNQTYTLDERRLFVAMMESCGLCFPLREEGYGPLNDDTYYLFPQFLPDEQPDSVRYFLANPIGKIIYRQTVPFLPDYHIRQLIARWGTKTKQENLWRNGYLVTLPHEGGFVLEADFTANTLTLTIEPTVSVETVAGLLRELRYEHTWWQTVNLTPPSVGDALTANPPAQPVRENLPDVMQTKTKKLVISYTHKDAPYVELFRKKMAAKRSIDLWYDGHKKWTRSWDEQIKENFTDCDGYIIFLSDTYMDEEQREYIHEKEIPIIRRRFDNDQVYVAIINVTPYNRRDTTLEPFSAFRDGESMPDPTKKDKAASQFLQAFIDENLYRDFLKPKTN